MIVGESQHNITSCLVDNPVPCTRIAEEPHTTSGTNPQTLNISHSSCLTNHHRCFPSLWHSPVPDTFGRKQEEPTKHEHSRKGFSAILTSSAYNNNLQEDQKRKETTDQRKSSKIRLQKKSQLGPNDANVSVIRDEHEMRKLIILRLRRLWGDQFRRNWWK